MEYVEEHKKYISPKPKPLADKPVSYQFFLESAIQLSFIKEGVKEKEKLKEIIKPTEALVSAPKKTKPKKASASAPKKTKPTGPPASASKQIKPTKAPAESAKKTIEAPAKAPKMTKPTKAAASAPKKTQVFNKSTKGGDTKNNDESVFTGHTFVAVLRKCGWGGQNLMSGLITQGDGALTVHSLRTLAIENGLEVFNKTVLERNESTTLGELRANLELITKEEYDRHVGKHKISALPKPKPLADIPVSYQFFLERAIQLGFIMEGGHWSG